MGKVIHKTKQVKCWQCEEVITVQKFAANKQLCARCQAGDSAETPVEDQPVTQRPVDKLRHAQDVLQTIGFVVSPRGWSKQYQDGDAVVKIEPYWDNGTSLDTNCTVEAFVVTRQEFVTVTDKLMRDKIPAVAHIDINTLMHELGVKGVNDLPAQIHIDAVKCTKCGEETADWISTTNGSILCLTKCAPVKRPYGR